MWGPLPGGAFGDGYLSVAIEDLGLVARSQIGRHLKGHGWFGRRVSGKP